MFEVFGAICFLSQFGYMDCKNYSFEVYDDPISCAVSANEYMKDHRYSNITCLYNPALSEGE